jgi:hypothetical protein
MNGTEEVPEVPNYGCKVNTIQMSMDGNIQLAYKGQPIPCDTKIGYGTGINFGCCLDLHQVILAVVRKFFCFAKCRCQISEWDENEGQ